MWSERSYRYYKSCISPCSLIKSLPLTIAVAALAFTSPISVQDTKADGGVPQAKCANISDHENFPSTKEDYKCIDEGFRLFTEETFEGNGRTCATCHIPEANYNIFPSTIKKLSKKQKKLVFVPHVPGLENEDLIREHALFNISGGVDSNGDLVYGGDATNTGEFDHADVNENAHKGVVFRSTMTVAATDLTKIHTTRRGTPLAPPACSNGGQIDPAGPVLNNVRNQLPQLGWAGDGAPGTPNGVLDDRCRTHHGSLDVNADGSLRAFANGAIAQHNPKSLKRVAKTDVCDPDPDKGKHWCDKKYDFRFATNDELDALEKFQEWLGRRKLTTAEADRQPASNPAFNNFEFDIISLNFKDQALNRGRDHFLGAPEFIRINANPNPGPPIFQNAFFGVDHPDNQPNSPFGAGCQGCHFNGGANGFVGRLGENNNVNTDVELGSDDIGIDVVGEPLPHDEGTFGSVGPPGNLEAFNVQSIIEAALKDAHFHNHRVVGPVEDAIRFYHSDDFKFPDGFPTEDNSVVHGPAFTSTRGMECGDPSASTTSNNFGDKCDGIEHVGAFLRGLAAYYKLRDCERLINESIDRMKKSHDPKVASFHCELNLKDVKRVLSQSQLPIYSAVIAESNKARRQLKSAINYWNLPKLKKVLARVTKMKDSIATHGETVVAAN